MLDTLVIEPNGQGGYNIKIGMREVRNVQLPNLAKIIGDKKIEISMRVNGNVSINHLQLLTVLIVVAHSLPTEFGLDNAQQLDLSFLVSDILEQLG